MDENEPVLTCDQCSKPVWPNDQYRLVTVTDKETGESTVPGTVVHNDCWPVWADAHDVKDGPDLRAYVRDRWGKHPRAMRKLR
jgi:hypothetical protein